MYNETYFSILVFIFIYFVSEIEFDKREHCLTFLLVCLFVLSLSNNFYLTSHTNEVTQFYLSMFPIALICCSEHIKAV